MSAKRMSKKWIILGVLVLVALIASAAILYAKYADKPLDGLKTISVTVIHADETKKELSLRTDADFLRQALEEENLIEGTESASGLFVETVDGETADVAKQQWWSFSKGGEMLMTGVDTTPILDGEAYEITLTTGW